MDAVVDGGLGEGHRAAFHVPQLAQVEDLHAVGAGVVRHDECVVTGHLHVPPHVDLGPFGQGQVTQVDGVVGVGDVDEGGAVVSADHGVLPARLGIGPAPEIVHDDAPLAAQVSHGQEGDQVHLLAGE
jgi:hypothetical protein